MKKLRLENKVNSSIDLVLKEPFYVDRKKRTPLIRSPRCLSNHRKDGIPKCSCMTSCLTDKQVSKQVTSCIDSPSQRRYGVVKQLDLLKTHIFKQKLKKLLFEYRKMRQQQTMELKEKSRKQRQQQLERIAKSIQKLISQNRKIYNSVKREKQISKILLANLKINLKKDHQLLKIIDSQSSEEDECKKERILKDGNQKSSQSHQQIQIGQQFLRQIEKNNEQQILKTKNNVEQFLSTFKRKWNENKNNKQYIGSLFDEINRMERKKKKQLQNQLNCLQSDSKDFYLVVKQLLRKTNNQKNKDKISKNILPICEDLKTKKFTQKHTTFAKNVESRLVENRKPRYRKEYKFYVREGKSNRSMSSKNKKRDETLKKQKMTKKKQDKNKKEIKLKSEEIVSERRSEKSKTIRNRFQLGIDYAKLINKMFKNSENDSNFSDKFRYVRHKKIRIAQLKKKNKFIAEEEPISVNKVNVEQKQKRLEQVSQKKNEIQSQQSCCEMEYNEEQKSEKLIKLTKYEQARLIFNMRFTNFKQRNLLASQKDLNNQIHESQSQKKKHYDIPFEKKNRVLKNSFMVAKNYEQFDFLNDLNQMKRNSKFSSVSKRLSILSNFNEQELCSSLALLTDYQSFNLQEVKRNITQYLRKLLNHNQKAKQFYNFLMFMQESQKAALEKQQISSSLDQLKIQQQQECIQNLISQLKPKIEEYEGCYNLYKDYNWCEQDLSLRNRNFVGKIDPKSIEMISCDQSSLKKSNFLTQDSLKQIQII